MRKVILFLSFILFICVGIAHAQAVFKKYGFKKAPLTLSKGKYNEFFTNDEVVQIGTVRFNTRTNKIIEFLEEDTTKNNYLSDRSSIWYSVDPLAEKFPNYSPYVYCENNPIKYIDPDGREKIIAVLKSGSHNDIIRKAAERFPDTDQNVIHIFAHGNSTGIYADNYDKPINSSERMIDYLNKNSETWKNRKEGEQITIVFHSCRTGQENEKNKQKSVAEKISEGMGENVTIIAPDRRDAMGSVELGPRYVTNVDSNDEYLGKSSDSKITSQKGNWVIFENGEKTGSRNGDWMPTNKPDLNYYINKYSSNTTTNGSN